MLETVDPCVIVEGRGMRVLDPAGKEFLDAVSSGVWTLNVGYGRESIADAVREQLVKMNYSPTPPAPSQAHSSPAGCSRRRRA